MKVAITAKVIAIAVALSSNALALPFPAGQVVDNKPVMRVKAGPRKPLGKFSP